MPLQEEQTEEIGTLPPAKRPRVEEIFAPQDPPAEHPSGLAHTDLSPMIEPSTGHVCVQGVSDVPASGVSVMSMSTMGLESVVSVPVGVPVGVSVSIPACDGVAVSDEMSTMVPMVTEAVLSDPTNGMSAGGGEPHQPITEPQLTTEADATYDPNKPRRWSGEEDERLKGAVKEFGEVNWKAIADRVQTRNHVQCLQRWKKVLKPGLVKGQWSAQEDAMLVTLVSESFKNWGQLAAHMPGRTSKQCRERWCHHLDPSIKKGEYTSDEDKTILDMQAKNGNKWAQIAQMLPGRTENAVKIRWKALDRSRKNPKGNGQAQIRSRNTPDSRLRSLAARAAAIAMSKRAQLQSGNSTPAGFPQDPVLITKIVQMQQAQLAQSHLASQYLQNIAQAQNTANAFAMAYAQQASAEGRDGAAVPSLENMEAAVAQAKAAVEGAVITTSEPGSLSKSSIDALTSSVSSASPADLTDLASVLPGLGLPATSANGAQSQQTMVSSGVGALSASVDYTPALINQYLQTQVHITSQQLAQVQQQLIEGFAQARAQALQQQVSTVNGSETINVPVSSSATPSVAVTSVPSLASLGGITAGTIPGTSIFSGDAITAALAISAEQGEEKNGLSHDLNSSAEMESVHAALQNSLASLPTTPQLQMSIPNATLDIATASAVPETTVQPPRAFQVSDRVQVRNDNQEWGSGTVLTMNPDGKPGVQKDGSVDVFLWDECRHISPLPAPEQQQQYYL